MVLHVAAIYVWFSVLASAQEDYEYDVYAGRLCNVKLPQTQKR